MNQSEISTSDGQTIPIVDEKVEFNLDRHRIGVRLDGETRPYPSHGVVSPDGPFFEEGPIDGHRNNNENGEGKQNSVDTHQKTVFALKA